MLIYIAKFFELCSLVFALVYFYKYRCTYLRYILYFLAYVVINGIIAGQLIPIELLPNNSIFYNVHQVILFLFLFRLAYISVDKPKNKKRIIGFTIIYSVIQIGDIIYNNFFLDYLSISYLAGAILTILAIIYYATELLLSRSIINLKQNLLVWFFSGNLMYFIGYIPIHFLYFLALANDLSSVIKIVHVVLIVMQNILFILGFVWAKRKCN